MTRNSKPVSNGRFICWMSEPNSKKYTGPNWKYLGAKFTFFEKKLNVNCQFLKYS
jgi:hypothetical protein